MCCPQINGGGLLPDVRTRHVGVMGRETQALGRYGEDIAVEFLASRGAQILERNWRARLSAHGVAGELDVVVVVGAHLVGVEVKTRSTAGFGHPLESITTNKLRRLHFLLAAWAREHGYAYWQRRVDAVAVFITGHRGQHPTVVVEHRPFLR